MIVTIWHYFRTEILQIYTKLNKLGNEVRPEGRIFGLSCTFDLIQRNAIHKAGDICSW